LKRLESVLMCSVLSAFLLASPALAAAPIKISDAFKAKLRQAVGSPNKLEALGVRARFGHSRSGVTSSAVRAAATAAVQAGGKASDGIISIPHFDFTATSGGQQFPLMFVGSQPKSHGKSTLVPNTIIPISITLPLATVDSQGNLNFTGTEVTFDGSSKVKATLRSPIFSPAVFNVPPGAGRTQWGDAMQRTTFFQQLLPRSDDWHVLLDTPAVTATVTTADFFDGFAVDFGDGTPIFAFVAGEFIDGIIASYLGSQDIDPGSVPIFVTYNQLLFYGGDTNNCCVLGYHDAVVTGNRGSNVIVQTFIFADWDDTGIFFGPVEDIHALSHEVAEWLNDPFLNNVVPPYANGEGTGCDTIMETGDQLVGNSVPVTINGFTYHPQTQDILQWFTREVPSSALGGLYTFPSDPNVPNTPAPVCTP
jgi:hypothetical protein